MVIGSIAVVLATGGCSGGDPDTADGSGSTAPLCERIGTDPLRKVIPSFEPDPPGEGESDACVRLAGGTAEAPTGDFLRITIEDPSPGTDEQCRHLELDRGDATWMPPDHLGGVGERACGTVAAGADKSVVVTILARRGNTHVSISYGRTPGDVATVRESVIDLARTVMQRV
jgi:hypothetical protein